MARAQVQLQSKCPSSGSMKSSEPKSNTHTQRRGLRDPGLPVSHLTSRGRWCSDKRRLPGRPVGRPRTVPANCLGGTLEPRWNSEGILKKRERAKDTGVSSPSSLSGPLSRCRKEVKSIWSHVSRPVMALFSWETTYCKNLLPSPGVEFNLMSRSQN